MVRRPTYKSSGVDIKEGDKASYNASKQLLKTFNQDCLLVNGLVALKADFKGYIEPLLALAADGVGTKLKYAFTLKENRSVGLDVVAMCVNDLARYNIRPLGFALYRATGKIEQKVMAEVAEGVVAGCLQAGCVYVTGETAEMPGFYKKWEYDLAGFSVGVFEKSKLLSRQTVKDKDSIIGIASSGVHSNGFSLLRKVIPPSLVKKNLELKRQIIEPTKIYVKPLLETNSRFDIRIWAHITGGGLEGKLSKAIPDGLQAVVKLGSWPVLDIFSEIQKRGSISDREMRRTFNLGLGMVGVVPEEEVSQVLSFLKEQGEKAYMIGEVRKASRGQKVVFR